MHPDYHLAGYVRGFKGLKYVKALKWGLILASGENGIGVYALDKNMMEAKKEKWFTYQNPSIAEAKMEGNDIIIMGIADDKAFSLKFALNPYEECGYQASSPATFLSDIA